MAYEILMPQLSDSMDEGVLVSWKVKEGQKVKIGDVIAEIESDKAIMEVQCFKNGEIEALHLGEGESAPVGTLIATISLSSKAQVSENDRDDKDERVKEEKKEVPSSTESYSLERVMASPKAKILAKRYTLNIHSLQKENKLPTPTHEKEITSYLEKRYFTPKALNLIKTYKLGINDFDLCKKYNTEQVQAYINKSELSTFKPIDAFQQSIIKNVKKSFEKPVFHIYEHIDSSYLRFYPDYSLSAWLIKIFATAMMEFDGFRSTMKDEGIALHAHASVSFAMLGGRKLYMPVIKEANGLSIKEIDRALKSLQEDINQSKLKSSQMQGSSFGISNLGRTGIEGFEALINQDDAGISAIGAEKDKRISVNLTIDHRLIDGYEAALFIQRVKALCLDEEFFKGRMADV